MERPTFPGCSPQKSAPFYSHQPLSPPEHQPAFPFWLGGSGWFWSKKDTNYYILQCQARPCCNPSPVDCSDGDRQGFSSYLEHQTELSGYLPVLKLGTVGYDRRMICESPAPGRSKACSQVCPSSASTRCCCSAQPHTAEQHDGPHIKAMWEWESFIIALCCCLQRCFPSSTAFIPGSWPRPFQRTSEVCLGLFLSLSTKPYQKKRQKQDR